MAAILVLAESDGSRVLPSTLPVITFAQRFAQLTSSPFDILVAGASGIEDDAEKLRDFGAARVITAASPDLAHPLADRVAAVCVQAMHEAGAAWLAGPSSTFGRDILPRIAGLLDLPMLSDVTNVEMVSARLTFHRPMYAGNVIATVQVSGDGGVFSVRGTAFDKPAKGSKSTTEALPVDVTTLPDATTWLGLDAPEMKRPELTTARTVVSGGRPLRDADTFERVIGGLADKLGGAVGATRAAVDSGIAANELQVGQTGKVVAPELYIAAGISGSVQHLAGMKDSKIIVAVNTDPDAPIFNIADYGIVADLFQVIPELTAKV